MPDTLLLAGPVGTGNQPISTVNWIPPDQLSANDWNPNKQAPPEYRLLKISILENGWTQPIVARYREGALQIVDGYHRWKISADPDIAAMTGGLVPVCVLPECDPALARLATIRHNRARGTHHVLGMADIVADLLDLGMSAEQIGARLEMDPEEVTRLADRGDMARRHGSDTGFSEGWTV